MNTFDVVLTLGHLDGNVVPRRRAFDTARIELFEIVHVSKKGKKIKEKALQSSRRRFEEQCLGFFSNTYIHIYIYTYIYIYMGVYICRHSSS